MEEKGAPRAVVERELRRAWEQDLHFRDARVYGSMCTAPLPVAAAAHRRFFEANLGNPGLCPGTKALEAKVVTWVARLLHGRGVGGMAVAGGTEANITALWMARNATKRREVVLSGNAHFSVLKACDLLVLKPVVVGLDGGYRMNVDKLRKAVSDDTAAVVGVAGTTELGVVDPIDEIAEICDGLPLHVDAAFGGFVLPFLRDLGRSVPPFDFDVEGVHSIGIDGHKMGLATIPSSFLLLREPERAAGIAVESPYLTTEEQTSLLGTRASAGVAATYAAMRSLGREGYRRVVKRCLANTEYLAKQAESVGLRLALPPPMNILGIRFRDPPAARAALEARGWQVSLARHPPCVRLVVMPHITRRSVEALAGDLEIVARKLGDV